MKIEDKIHELHEKIKEIFPDAVMVEIVVNSNGIEVKPEYKTDLRDFSMKNISNVWVRKAD